MGVPVAAFSFGLGPKLLGFTDRKGTTWNLRLIPFFGYTKAPALDEMSFGRQLPAIIAGPLANMLFILLCFSAWYVAIGRPLEVVLKNIVDVLHFFLALPLYILHGLYEGVNHLSFKGSSFGAFLLQIFAPMDTVTEEHWVIDVLANLLYALVNIGLTVIAFELMLVLLMLVLWMIGGLAVVGTVAKMCGKPFGKKTMMTIVVAAVACLGMAFFAIVVADIASRHL